MSNRPRRHAAASIFSAGIGDNGAPAPRSAITAPEPSADRRPTPPRPRSNSSDALDKIRFEGLTDKSRLEAQVRTRVHPTARFRRACAHVDLRRFSSRFDGTCQ